ncbi:MAG: M67 family metallopeptidase [Alphaproteobacteria bacterium]|nr:M67 family metallopeptidase [Alphaproteobacteria bacterium]
MTQASVRLPRACLRRIEEAARAAWPEECCGLLAGRRGPDASIEILRAVPAPNIAAERARRFEIDPQLWLDLRRQLAGGPDAILGLYHSHPDGAALPSPRDAAAAWPLGPADGPVVWLITAMRAGAVTETRAHAFLGADRGFQEISLVSVD